MLWDCSKGRRFNPYPKADVSYLETHIQEEDNNFIPSMGRLCLEADVEAGDVAKLEDEGKCGK